MDFSMRYSVALADGRLVDRRDVPYTENDLARLAEAYGAAEGSLVVYEDLDVSGVTSGTWFVDAETLAVSVAADEADVKRQLIALYAERAAISAAADATDIDFSSEISMVDDKIAEVVATTGIK